ncbi:helix-turn-helix domain-containing protein [Hwanghaeella grinnelliae]|uniref:Helix-turn-helix domain-containing protein n=1 Tax=Hwanghaeella grinnelliae TaxID=2500179 RepID=A0A437QWE3_9PROT|nr:helix-turn-helix domain-containing protein [Hwanghaeella grinnelliae]RVU38850.1 helix-turn-helix domain-containing protein [Hwanghaeella grinnelliae]
MKRTRTYSRMTLQALSILGNLIKIGRIERGMTAQDLAERAGISRTTLYSIEKGAPGPEIGTVFELAAIVGVQLFEPDSRNLAVQDKRLSEKLALLPQSVRRPKREVDDDF